MKKIKGILLTGLLLLGMLSFVGCGGANSQAKSPEEVATNFLENTFKKDMSDENIKKETLELIHSKISNKEDALAAAESLNQMFAVLKSQFKQYGAEEAFTNFLSATLNGIKINKLDEKIEGNTATLNYEMSVPTLDQQKFQETVTKLTTEKLKTAGAKFDENALTKEIMTEALSIAVKEIESGSKVEKETITIVLEKDGSDWKIVSTS